MRTREQELGGFITFSGVTPSGGASGVGVAQPGNIPFTYIRTGTGDYTFRFDPGLHVLSMQGVSSAGSAVPAGTYGPGTFRMQSFSATTLTDGIIHFVVRARDRRV